MNNRHSCVVGWATGQKAIAALALVSLAGCATTGPAGTMGKQFKDTFASDDPCSNNARNIGIAVGSVVGILLGSQLGNRNAATMLSGGAAGALVGGMIGANVDQRRCELAKIAKQYELDMTFQTIDVATGAEVVPTPGAQTQPVQLTQQAQTITLRDRQGEDEQFQSNSDVLTPRAYAYFSAIAQQFIDAPANPRATAAQRVEQERINRSRRLLLIGHTDDTGSSKLNAELSERRAKAVAALLRSQGVPDSQLYFQGAGEGYPVASNDDDQGRALNRRVEFVEVYGDEGLASYLDSRRANYDLYRPQAVQFAKAASTTRPAPPAVGLPAGTGQAAKDAAPTTARKGTTPSVAARGALPSGKLETAGSAQATVPPGGIGTQAAVTRPAFAMDFGGEPLSITTAWVDLGNVPSKKPGITLISNAQADPPFIARCDRDRPRIIGAVKSLKGADQQLPTTAYKKGLYGTTWHDMVNGNLVVLNKVYVLQDGSTPSLPELKFYANYNSRNSAEAKPLWQGTPQVNVYSGRNGILYRVFAGDGGPANCLDILLPSDGGLKAKEGRVVYGESSQPYVAMFAPGTEAAAKR